MNTPIAIIDIGSNSARMLVARMESNHLTVIDEHKEYLGLVTFVDEQDRKRTQEVVHELICSSLQRMISIAKAHQPVYRLLATHAVRQMTFYPEIVNRIFRNFGLHLEVIDGLEEARLAALGIEQGLDLHDELFLGVDIGGGSTEIILREKHETLFSASISSGALSLTRDYLDSENYSEADYYLLQREVMRSLVPVIHDLQKTLGSRTPIAVISSGTAKALATISIRQPEKSLLTDDMNGMEISRDKLQDINRRLFTAGSPKAIEQQFEVSESRSRIILAGSAIVVGISDLLHIENWRVSSFGLREGAVYDTVLRTDSPTPYQVDRLEKVKLFARQCRVDIAHAVRVSDLCLRMYEQLTELQPDRFECTSVTNLGELIQLAGLLYECGRFISFPKFHRHSYYMIFHSRLPGLNQKQRQWIALIARHHRKSICRADRPETSYIQDNEIKVINSLAGILRLVSSLYRTREDNITSLGVHESNGGLHFEVHFTRDHNPEVCLLQAQLEVPNLRKAFGCNVRVSCTNQALSST